MDAVGASRIASGGKIRHGMRERAERAERRADRLEVDAGARGGLRRGRGAAPADLCGPTARRAVRPRRRAGAVRLRQARRAERRPRRRDDQVSQERARRASRGRAEVVCRGARTSSSCPASTSSCWNCGLRVSSGPVCRVAIQQKRRVSHKGGCASWPHRKAAAAPIKRAHERPRSRRQARAVERRVVPRSASGREERVLAPFEFAATPGGPGNDATAFRSPRATGDDDDKRFGPIPPRRRV